MNGNQKSGYVHVHDVGDPQSPVFPSCESERNVFLQEDVSFGRQNLFHCITTYKTPTIQVSSRFRVVSSMNYPRCQSTFSSFSCNWMCFGNNFAHPIPWDVHCESFRTSTPTTWSAGPTIEHSDSTNDRSPVSSSRHSRKPMKNITFSCTTSS